MCWPTEHRRRQGIRKTKKMREREREERERGREGEGASFSLSMPDIVLWHASTLAPAKLEARASSFRCARSYKKGSASSRQLRWCSWRRIYDNEIETETGRGLNKIV
jgi:hypothetical protein